ncbi:hypothetical protein KY285_036114 [Solanum tuberosum]|nr:hypothetical protein KY285_036114 [Solanum tuberosum]
MGNPFKLDYGDLPVHYCIRCCVSKTRVSFIEDYISLEPNIQEGLFIDTFNVHAPHEEIYYQVVGDCILVDAYCVQCGVLLRMKNHMLIYWNDVTLLQHYEEQVGDEGVNEQGVGANDHDPGVNQQDGGANDKYLGANEQNVVQVKTLMHKMMMMIESCQ